MPEIFPPAVVEEFDPDRDAGFDTSDVKKEDPVTFKDPPRIDLGNKSYFYPLEMKNKALEYPGVVTYSARRVDIENTISGLLSGIIEGTKEFLTAGAEAASEQIRGLTTALEDADASVEDDLTRSKSLTDFVGDKTESTKILFAEAIAQAEKALTEGSSSGSKQTVVDLLDPNNQSSTPQGRVYMPLPKDLRFDDQMQYNTNAELGTIGGGVEAGMMSGGGALKSLVASTAGAARQVFTGQKSAATSAAVITLLQNTPLLGNTSAVSGVTSAQRITSNPNIRTLFNGVQIRTFAHSFKLIGVNQNEAEEIKDIIRFFRMNMYPEEILFGGIPIGYFFPNVFDIRFRYKTREIAHKILPSYLVSMQVSYNSTDQTLHADGNFTEVDITLNFAEAYTLHRGLIQAGY